jgi:hypothetical protein
MDDVKAALAELYKRKDWANSQHDRVSARKIRKQIRALLRKVGDYQPRRRRGAVITTPPPKEHLSLHERNLRWLEQNRKKREIRLVNLKRSQERAAQFQRELNRR